jgi:hypothetical protein
LTFEKEIERVIAPAAKPNPNTGLPKLLELFKQNDISVTCSCQGGRGHLYNLPTIEVTPIEYSEVEDILALMKVHGFTTFTIRLSFEHGRVLTCRIQFKESIAMRPKSDKMVVQPGAPMDVYAMSGLGTVPID